MEVALALMTFAESAPPPVYVGAATSDHLVVTARATDPLMSSFAYQIQRLSVPVDWYCRAKERCRCEPSWRRTRVSSPGHARIGVQAMAKKGFEMERAPYALAVTIEIGVEQRSQLYSEVLNELVRTRSRVRQLS